MAGERALSSRDLPMLLSHISRGKRDGNRESTIR
jgi:hypothetical protein